MSWPASTASAGAGGGAAAIAWYIMHACVPLFFQLLDVLVGLFECSLELSRVSLRHGLLACQLRHCTSQHVQRDKDDGSKGCACHRMPLSRRGCTEPACLPACLFDDLMRMDGYAFCNNNSTPKTFQPIAYALPCQFSPVLAFRDVSRRGELLVLLFQPLAASHQGRRPCYRALALGTGPAVAASASGRGWFGCSPGAFARSTCPLVL